MNLVKRFLGLLGLLALAGCVQPHRAAGQFIGYTSPQTTQQTLATNVACTGVSQIFPVNNLGQTQHYLNVAVSVGMQRFQAELDGVDTLGNVYRISDVLEVAGVSAQKQGSISGSGYFPKVQVAVNCSPNTATFSVSYSGGWGTFNLAAGSYLSAQIDKLNFSNAPENTTQTDNFQTPFGSSAGTLFVQYTTASIAGSAITVQCGTNGTVGPVTAFTASLANSLLTQSFVIPDTACPFATITYSTGGGGAGTVTAEYILSLPGRNPGGASIGSVTQGTVPWVVSGTVTANTVPSLSSTILSGQQSVTTGDVALATNTLTHGICVTAFSTNTASVFVGTTGVSTSTGLELPAKASTCLAVSNSNAVHVIAAAGGSSVSWVGN